MHVRHASARRKGIANWGFAVGFVFEGAPSTLFWLWAPDFVYTTGNLLQFLAILVRGAVSI
jgi:hypothetical protein